MRISDWSSDVCSSDLIEDFETRIQEQCAYTERGVLVNSGEYDGLDSGQALDALSRRFEADGNGQRRVNFRLRAWGVSRPRRSEARRVGDECVSTCRSRGTPCH